MGVFYPSFAKETVALVQVSPVHCSYQTKKSPRRGKPAVLQLGPTKLGCGATHILSRLDRVLTHVLSPAIWLELSVYSQPEEGI